MSQPGVLIFWLHNPLSPPWQSSSNTPKSQPDPGPDPNNRQSSPQGQLGRASCILRKLHCGKTFSPSTLVRLCLNRGKKTLGCIKATERREQRCMLKFKQALNSQQGSPRGTRRLLPPCPCRGHWSPAPPGPKLHSGHTHLRLRPALREGRSAQSKKHAWVGLTVLHQTGSTFWCLHLLTEMCHQ